LDEHDNPVITYSGMNTIADTRAAELRKVTIPEAERRAAKKEQERGLNATDLKEMAEYANRCGPSISTLGKQWPAYSRAHLLGQASVILTPMQPIGVTW
jgi:hypothetical protein